MHKIVSAGIKRDEFPEQDPHLAAVQIAGIVQSVTDAMIEKPDRFGSADVAQTTADFCLRALTGTSAPF